MVTDYTDFCCTNGQMSDEQETPLVANAHLKERRGIRYEAIRDPKDVRDCLHLRYMTYRYVNFIEENKDRLDIDPYDRYATFLGAYDVTRGQKILAGTVRVIGADEKGACSPYIDELIRTARDPKIRALSERPKLFPMLESFTLPESFLACFGNIEPNEEPINEELVHPYEISRLAIRPDYWLHSIDVGLHHLLILDSWLHNPPHRDFLIAVHPRSRRRYERIGFRVVPGTGQVLYKNIEQLAIAMIIDLEEYLQRPDSYRKTCESLLPYFEKYGYFTRIIEPLNHSR